MKHFILWTFIIFAAAGSCVSATAQVQPVAPRQWMYAGDDGGSWGGAREEYIIYITEHPNGYVVSGQYTSYGTKCTISGGYSPAGRFISAKLNDCNRKESDGSHISGTWEAESDTFYMSAHICGTQVKARRNGIKPRSDIIIGARMKGGNAAAVARGRQG